ncbi:MAG TPA: biotin--[acetyl-CoA-carboxylase] ligase [Nitrososphaerales archaeon]|nr:biotin--[acetyl-CoA-carboxylase] ligase [Nitrososphaerales archaeon]
MVTWIFVEFDEVDSTQTIAKRLATDDAPEGTVVVAKSQTSGKGRLGRDWVSPEGGLYMSLIIRPYNLSRPELVTLASAVAVAQGIRRTTGLSTAIRWPNDVMVNNRKIAGTIAEAEFHGHDVTHIIVGIGVNCNAGFSGMRGLQEEATSLGEESGREVDVSELRRTILDSFSQAYGDLQSGEDTMLLWRKHVMTVGKRVLAKLKTSEEPLSCIAVNIDPRGNLIVQRDEAATIIHPEDLEWLREET